MGLDQRLESLQVTALQLIIEINIFNVSPRLGKYKLGMCVFDCRQPDFLVAPDV